MKTILLIDKDPVSTTRVSDILQQSRHRILHASTLESGRRLVRNEKPDLVIYHFPRNVLSVREAMQSTHETFSAQATPLLCIIGRSDLPKAPEILGPKQYLAKPFTHDELLNAVADHLKEGSRDRASSVRSGR